MPFEFIKAPENPAVAEVLDLKLDEGMSVFGIDVIFRGQTGHTQAAEHNHRRDG